jgi:hypothetical protein
MYLYCIEDRFSTDEQEHSYAHTDGLLVPRHLWEEWTSTCSSTMCVRLSQQQSHTQTQICVVASYHKEDADSLYAPQWMFHTLKKGEEVQYETLWDDDDEEVDLLPQATQIKVKPLDNAFYHSDIQENLSEYLSHFQTLQKNTVLSIPIKELGGFCVDILVEDCQPSSEVLLRGEVPLELSEPMETVAEWEPIQPQPITQSRDTPQESFDDVPMIPTIPVPIKSFYTGKGNVLGK